MKTLIRLNRTGIATLNFPIIQIYRTTKHKKGVPHKNEQKLANKEHNTTRGTTNDDTLKNKGSSVLFTLGRLLQPMDHVRILLAFFLSLLRFR